MPTIKDLQLRKNSVKKTTLAAQHSANPSTFIGWPSNSSASVALPGFTFYKAACASSTLIFRTGPRVGGTEGWADGQALLSRFSFLLHTSRFVSRWPSSFRFADSAL